MYMYIMAWNCQYTQILLGLVVISVACVHFTKTDKPLTSSTSDRSLSETVLRHIMMNKSDAGSPVCPPCSCFCNDVNRTEHQDRGAADPDSVIPSASLGKESLPWDRCRNVKSIIAPDVRNGDEPSGARVLILASMRTGSSFIGEIFGRNEEVFYLFEPDLVLQKELHSREANFLRPLYIDMLISLYGCNATAYDFYIQWMNKEGPLGLLKKVPRLFDLLCHKSPDGIQGLKCGEISKEFFMQTCQEQGNVAIKSIRVWDIGMLGPLIEDSSVNLKVIHLVRDPRGMIASRVIAFNNAQGTAYTLRDSFTDEMLHHLINFCSYSIDNKEVGYYLPKYRNNYFLLRYEDMSLDPVGTTQRIYDFVGLGAVPENVLKWLAENTNANNPGIYSTTRVSSKAYQSWRTKFDFARVKAIEQVGRCAEMMTHFGYLPVMDELHLKNLSSSLLVQIPSAHDFERYRP